MAHPRRCGHYQDVGGQQLVSDNGPLITVTHIGLNARRDVVVDTADRVALDSRLAEVGEQVLGNERAARRRRTVLQAADQRYRAQRRMRRFGSAHPVQLPAL